MLLPALSLVRASQSDRLLLPEVAETEDAALAESKGGDTKIELGFSMTLAGAIPGIHPEGRRLGALRLGRRLETPKSQVWFLPTTGAHR